jgi:hypothetical protein
MVWIVLHSLLAFAAGSAPTPFPVFLKLGFSSVLEFPAPPKRVVVGDGASFQVERVDHSLVIRPLVSSASSNLFVYFEKEEPRLFVLTASDEAEPTLYHKFADPKQASVSLRPSAGMREVRGGGSLLRATRWSFDTKKDFLTLDAELCARKGRPIAPDWGKALLAFGAQPLNPARLWAEREEVQRDACVRARFVFLRPNLPRDLVGVRLVLPLKNEDQPISTILGRKK